MTSQYRGATAGRMPEKGCGLDCPTPSKTGWLRRRDARKALRLLPGAAGMRVYLCRCGSFHLGHNKYEHRAGPELELELE